MKGLQAVLPTHWQGTARKQACFSGSAGQEQAWGSFSCTSDVNNSNAQLLARTVAFLNIPFFNLFSITVYIQNDSVLVYSFGNSLGLTVLLLMLAFYDDKHGDSYWLCGLPQATRGHRYFFSLLGPLFSPLRPLLLVSVLLSVLSLNLDVLTKRQLDSDAPSPPTHGAQERAQRWAVQIHGITCPSGHASRLSPNIICSPLKPQAPSFLPTTTAPEVFLKGRALGMRVKFQLWLHGIKTAGWSSRRKYQLYGFYKLLFILDDSILLIFLK